MTWVTFAPALLLTAISLVLSRRTIPLHPAWASRLLLVLCLTTAIVALSTAALVAAVFVAGLLPADVVATSPKGRLLLGHGPVNPVLGGAALLLLGHGAAGSFRVLRRRRLQHVRLRRTGIVADDRPFAFAVPGRTGGVVISRGLMRLLTPAQIAVVFRHEHSHLRHRHHLYTTAGAVAAHMFPPLTALDSTLRLSVERWADEDAAEAVGDRTLVAGTIAQVALADPAAGTSPAQALASSHVVQRVEALLADAPSSNAIAGPALLSGTGVATSGMISSTLQMQHITSLLLL